MTDICNQFSFEKSFDQILSRLLFVDSKLFEIVNTLKTIITYNVYGGKQTRGKILMQTFKILKNYSTLSAIEQDVELVSILGWTVEFFQAYFLMIDDIIDQSSTRRGKPCWYKMVIIVKKLYRFH